jgi:hypothetical protein
MILFYLSLLLTAGEATIATEPIVPAKIRKVKEVIKVYPTPNNRGSLTVQSANDKALSFYLFDLEGKLVYQSPIGKNEKLLVQGLTSGTYLYNAFLNDENLEGGKVELK